MGKSLEDELAGLLVPLVIIGFFVALILYVAAWATGIAGVIGTVIGIVVFIRCAQSKATVIRNIKARGTEGQFRSMCRAYSSVVADGDLQMDIWLNKGFGEYVAPGDDVRPRSTYGFVRFASWPFLIRWIPVVVSLVFSVFLRVGFLICFTLAVIKHGAVSLFYRVSKPKEKKG